MAARLILAHVESVHAKGAGQVLRLGPLLPLALVVLVALFSRGLAWRRVVRHAAATALVAVGVLHLALFPDHLREGLVVGLFFLAAAVAQVAVGIAVAFRPSPAVTRLVLGVNGALVAVYVAARFIRLPFTGGPEDVDGIGLVTKAIEILAIVLVLIADRPVLRWPRPTSNALVAGTLAVVAVTAQPLFDEGPSPLHAAVAIATASIVAMIIGERSSSHLAVAIVDGAGLALLARGPTIATAVVLPALAELIRAAARWVELRTATPAAWALVLGLTIPQFHGRLEVLHVGHPSEPIAALVVFLVTIMVAVAVWQRGQLALTAAFVVTHLTGQAMRVLADRTSFEAVEIPAASLGLLLMAAVLLADVDLRASWRLLAGIGVASGGLDVVLRDRAVAYAPVVAIATVPSWSAPARLCVPCRLSHAKPEIGYRLRRYKPDLAVRQGRPAGGGVGWPGGCAPCWARRRSISACNLTI